MDIMQLLEEERYTERLISMYLSNFPEETEQDARAHISAEIFNFFVATNEKNIGTQKNPLYIENVSSISIMKEFATVVCNKLSFSLNHAYIQSKAGVLDVGFSPYGEAQMRISKNVILAYDEPIVYYDCDRFKMYFSDGVERIEYEMCEDRPDTAKVKGVFMRVIRHDGSHFFSHFSKKELDDFKNKGFGENQAWKSIVGMAKAKCMKHTFKRQPNSFVKR